MKHMLNFVGAALVVGAAALNAANPPQILLNGIRIDGEVPVEFTFTDTGTGAQSYSVRYAESLGQGGWSILDDAAIDELGGGRYVARIPEAAGATGFYRIVGLSANGESVTANFAATAITVTEGESLSVTIVFDSPYTGTIHYTVGGSAANGIEPLSGQIDVVNSATAVIPVLFKDDLAVGELRQLILTLETGTRVRTGSGFDTTLTIADNDTDWRGGLILDEVALGFVLRIAKENGAVTATLRGDGLGIFPEGATTAEVLFAGESFEATVKGIALAAPASQFGVASTLTLRLTAVEGVEGQSVGERSIEGAATLVTQYAGKPFLNSTSTGTFTLLRSPALPSSTPLEFTQNN